MRWKVLPEIFWLTNLIDQINWPIECKKDKVLNWQAVTSVRLVRFGISGYGMNFILLSSVSLIVAIVTTNSSTDKVPEEKACALGDKNA